MPKKIKTDERTLLCLEIQVLETAMERAKLASMADSRHAPGTAVAATEQAVSSYLDAINERLGRLDLT